MKAHLVIAALALVLHSTARAADPALPAKLTTLKGQTYEGVAIRSVEPDGVRILHSAGFAKIKFEELPENLRAQFDADPAKAAAYREEQAAKQRAALQSIEDAKAKAMKQSATLPPPAPTPKPEATAPPPEDGKETLVLPQPTKGRIYDVAELRGIKADLAGQVVRVRLIANSVSNAEQNEDGTYEMFVGGADTAKDDYTTVIFPKAAATYVKLFNKTTRGEMTFYALVLAKKFDWLIAVGRTCDPGTTNYRW